MKLQRLLAPVLLAAASQFAHAAPLTPTFDVFGPLPTATFSGTGIPFEPVAITEITVGSDVITLGLSATQRYSNPPIGNDGAGTFKAGAGANTGNPGPMGSPVAALWNFNYYIRIDGGGSLDDYQFDLFYDFDPGAMTDQADLGRIDITAGAIAGMAGGLSLLEDSQNLTFDFLASSMFPGVIFPPAAGSFDPFATGEYSFALIVSTLNLDELGRVSINVNVPEPGSLALLGLALAAAGAAGARRRC